MSLKISYNTIKNLITNYVFSFKLNPPLKKQLSVLENMESDKLYVENVRWFFGIPVENAEFLCEQGVREGIFEKKIDVKCDLHGVIYTSLADQKLPEFLTCDNCKTFGKQNYRFDTKDLNKLTFYTFRK